MSFTLVRLSSCRKPCTLVFAAGIVTTLVVLRSLIAILVNHPELQTRMQKEIDHVLGEAEPRLEDRDKLPYVNAVSSRTHIRSCTTEHAVGCGPSYISTV